MKVIELNSDWYDKYNFYLSNHRESMIYHSLNYKFFINDLLGAKDNYLIAIDNNNEIKGVLPIFKKEGSLGTVYNSLPFYGSNGGIISKDEQAKRVLLTFYNGLVTKKDVAAATLIDNPLDQNYPYNLINISEKDFRVGQLSRIEGNYKDLEDLMVLFHYKTRNTIRKAIKSEVKVSVENNLFVFLEETHKENMVSIGGLAKPKDFFRLVQQKFEAGKDYRIYVARYNEVPVAAVLIFYYNKTVDYYTPVIVKEFRHLQALSLLITKAMFDAANNSFIWWNWGGTWSTQEGV